MAVSYDKRSNRHGDLLQNWEYFPTEKLAGYGGILPSRKIRESLFRDLNDFAAYTLGRKAEVFMTFSSFPEPEYKRNMQTIEDMVRECHERLQLKILGTPEDFLFPYNYFSNSIYHLRFEGRDIRTATLIRRMEQAGITAASPGKRQ